MEKKVNLVAVGIFVIVLTVTAIASVLYLSSAKFYGKTYDTYLTYMSESVAGLNLSSAVRYRGVDVGKVRDIRLAPGNVEQVQVTMQIERGTPVKQDTVAQLQSQGLTGIAFIDLTAGRRDSPVLKAKPDEPYPVIASGPSLMGRLESSLPGLLAGLSNVSGNVNAALDEENRRALKQTLADTQVLAHTLAKRARTIDAGLADAATTMRNTARASSELPQLAQRVARSADAFDRMTAQLGSVGPNASEAIAATRSDFQKFAAETMPEVRELVPELRELVAELRTAAATLQRTADAVERNPGVLLAPAPRPRLGPGE